MRSVANLTKSELYGRRALVRVDYNVPLDDGKITDDTRIEATLPTISFLLHKGAQVILMSHLGRPGGKPDPALSLAPVAKHLEELLNELVAFVPDCLGRIPDMSEARIVILENLRFYAGEKENEEDFAKRLASRGDIYVNDAFANCHRAHASMVGVPKYLPGGAGLLLAHELEVLSLVIERPEKPLVLFLGGAKLKTKLPVIESFLKRADHLFIGGAMAFTFLDAVGLHVGNSLVDEDFKGKALALMEDSVFQRKAVLPKDVVAAKDTSGEAENSIAAAGAIPEGLMGLDLGPRAIEDALNLIKEAKTVIWNGPLGLSDVPAYEEGTRRVALALADADAKVILGGGETVNDVSKMGLKDRFYHVSTGGGAFLTLLAGLPLPAVEALK